jgi:hypothetical protein
MAMQKEIKVFVQVSKFPDLSVSSIMSDIVLEENYVVCSSLSTSEHMI